MRILIAEDERSLNEIIAKKLTSDGYSVDCCYDGEEAISVLSYSKAKLDDDDGRGVYEIDAHSGAIPEASAEND